jgi:exodeoxyribonuclease-3
MRFEDMSLTIATWNVNSITARLPLALRWLESQVEETRPDVVCFQEIKCIDPKFPAGDFAKLGYFSLIFGQPAYNGVAILVRDELTNDLGEVQKGFPGDAEDAPRRLLAATIAGVRIINVYIPNGQAVGSEKYVFKLEWLGRLRAYLAAHSDPAQPLVLCGDFNVAPEPLDVYDPVAWEGKVLFSLPEREALQAVGEWGLVDAFRQLNPTSPTYSWWDYRQAGFRRNLGARIDHIWVTAPLMQRCQQVTIDAEPRGWERPSDHTPVIARFVL